MEMRKQPLQPSTVLELIDRTFRIYRENFLTFLVPVALVTVPITNHQSCGDNPYTQRAQPLLQDLQNSSPQRNAAAQLNS